ncbi:MAG: hypothetical protein HY909_11595 [Deltaproteobacteria bacterium]|jgi:hypothetical protein|nr:hypothetical protein [Deltaproteobacteria bacterium]
MKTGNCTILAALLAGASLSSGCLVTAQGGYGASVNTQGSAVAVNTTSTVATTTSTTATATVAVPTFNARISAAAAVPQGVTVLQTQCVQGSAEQCNGLDDNCNGVIDEGCGYQGGNIQVTAAWGTSSDIDLHVTDPMGEEVYFGHRQSSSGGVLDHDANAACSVAPPTVENVYWSSPQPPQGTYQVRMVAYDMCNNGATPVTMSIAVGGRVIGIYQYTFTYSHQEFTMPFTVQ